jgi:hypothetical protein
MRKGSVGKEGERLAMVCKGLSQSRNLTVTPSRLHTNGTLLVTFSVEDPGCERTNPSQADLNASLVSRGSDVFSSARLTISSFCAARSSQ